MTDALLGVTLHSLPSFSQMRNGSCVPVTCERIKLFLPVSECNTNIRVTRISAACRAYAKVINNFLLRVQVVRIIQRGLWPITSLLVLCLLPGCGGTVKGAVEKIVPASGTIKLDGRPTGGIRISLTPINETKSVGGAWAVSKDDGTFTVMHWSNKEGITPGSYQITFSKLVKPDGSPLGDGDSPAMVNAKEMIAPMWSKPDAEKMAAIMRRVDIPESGKKDIEF